MRLVPQSSSFILSFLPSFSFIPPFILFSLVRCLVRHGRAHSSLILSFWLSRQGCPVPQTATCSSETNNNKNKQEKQHNQVPPGLQARTRPLHPSQHRQNLRLPRTCERARGWHTKPTKLEQLWKQLPIKNAAGATPTPWELFGLFRLVGLRQSWLGGDRLAGSFDTFVLLPILPFFPHQGLSGRLQSLRNDALSLTLSHSSGHCPHRGHELQSKPRCCERPAQ